MPTAVLKQEVRCKKCGGNIFGEVDQYGLCVFCLQCGAEINQNGELQIRDPIAEGINVSSFDRRRGDRLNEGQHSFKRKIRSRSW